jgi:hypothetical protein
MRDRKGDRPLPIADGTIKWLLPFGGLTSANLYVTVMAHRRVPTPVWGSAGVVSGCRMSG